MGEFLEKIFIGSQILTLYKRCTELLKQVMNMAATGVVDETVAPSNFKDQQIQQWVDKLHLRHRGYDDSSHQAKKQRLSEEKPKPNSCLQKVTGLLALPELHSEEPGQFQSNFLYVL